MSMVEQLTTTRFDLAEDFLANLAPPSPNGVNPADSLKADRAVLSVAPFPSDQTFDPTWDPEKNAGILSAIPSLINVLLSQSRFSGESLASVASGTSFSRFVVAPSDPEAPHGKALQCSALNAFGGFFERGFRAHDYQLGRRNCQRFLQRHFILPENNTVIATGLDATGANRAEIIRKFGQDPPNAKVAPQKVRWIPIIPLCGTAVDEVPIPKRGQISDENIDLITGLILHRIQALLPLLLKGLSPGFVKVLVNGELDLYLKHFAKKELVGYLKKNLTVNSTAPTPSAALTPRLLDENGIRNA
jgi:hypothetical protein